MDRIPMCFNLNNNQEEIIRVCEEQNQNGLHGMVPVIDQRLLKEIKSEVKGPKILYKTSAAVQETINITSPFDIDENNYSSLAKLIKLTA